MCVKICVLFPEFLTKWSAGDTDIEEDSLRDGQKGKKGDSRNETSRGGMRRVRGRFCLSQRVGLILGSRKFQKHWWEFNTVGEIYSSIQNNDPWLLFAFSSSLCLFRTNWSWKRLFNSFFNLRDNSQYFQLGFHCSRFYHQDYWLWKTFWKSGFSLSVSSYLQLTSSTRLKPPTDTDSHPAPLTLHRHYTLHYCKVSISNLRHNIYAYLYSTFLYSLCSEYLHTP